MDCHVCYIKFNNLDPKLECLHMYHKDCLMNGFDEALKKEDLLLFHCYECKKLISDEFLFKNFDAKYLTIKSDILFFENYYKNDNIILCPNCQMIYEKLKENTQQFFDCKFCNVGFCLKCRSDKHAHIPDCIENQKDIMKGNLCQACYRCKSYYTKTTGCNTMRCPKKSCAASFCNLCLAPFKSENDCVAHYQDKNNKCYGKQFSNTN